MLDTARFSYFVAEKLAVPVGAVRTLTLGWRGNTMVPVPSACTVNGQPLERSPSCPPPRRSRRWSTEPGTGGGEIVALLKTGSAYFAPSAAAAPGSSARWRRSSGAVFAVCAWVDGQVRDLQRLPWVSRPRSARPASAGWSSAS